MENLKKLSAEFIGMVQSTKNLSSKTVLVYSSDLKDFCTFVDENEINDGTILKYIQLLSQKRCLKDSTISRKLIVLKMFFHIYMNIDI